MNFELLISTMNKSMSEVQVMLSENNIFCNTLVVVQGDIEGYEELLIETQLIRVVFTKERGLSKSRNLAISYCNADYAFIMDDDVDIDCEALEEVIFQANKDNSDIFTCKFLYKSGGSSKPNLDSVFFHDFITLASVNSIEIGFRVESIKKNRIKFNESFGLGTSLPSGEEYIFLTDCLKKGLKVKYYPFYIGIHPDITSGMDFYTTSSKILAKREMLKHIFKWKSSFFILAFWLKKTPKLIREGYWAKFSKIFLLGLK